MSLGEAPSNMARRLARKIDVSEVQAAAIDAAEAAAYGVCLPSNLEDRERELARLDEIGAPRDATAWRKAEHETRLRLTFPIEAIVLWVQAARVEDPASVASKIAMPFAEACWEFRERRGGEGLDWKQGKTVGLSNQELRSQFDKIGSAAKALAQAMLELQSEAQRPGHADTLRGARVRALYQQASNRLIAEMALEAGLKEGEAAILERLRPILVVEGNSYGASSALLETALLRFGRWCHRARGAESFWSALPQVDRRSTKTRDDFIRRLAQLWELGTRTPATCTPETEASKASGFVIFIECVYGHFRGLAEAQFDQEHAAGFLNALGLDRPPTARTLSKILRFRESGSSG